MCEVATALEPEAGPGSELNGSDALMGAGVEMRGTDDGEGGGSGSLVAATGVDVVIGGEVELKESVGLVEMEAEGAGLVGQFCKSADALDAEPLVDSFKDSEVEVDVDEVEEEGVEEMEVVIEVAEAVDRVNEVDEVEVVVDGVDDGEAEAETCIRLVDSEVDVCESAVLDDDSEFDMNGGDCRISVVLMAVSLSPPVAEVVVEIIAIDSLEASEKSRRSRILDLSPPIDVSSQGNTGCDTRNSGDSLECVFVSG